MWKRIHRQNGYFVEEKGGGTLVFHGPGRDAECYEIDPLARTFTRTPGREITAFRQVRAIRLVWKWFSRGFSKVHLELITHGKQRYVLYAGSKSECESLARRLTAMGLPEVVRPAGLRAAFGLPAKA